MEQIQLPKQDYKVLVRCYTYNQAPYIEDALTGFVMQQTDFPFVCLVVDDCSTDGEQEVIKSFLNRECYMEDAEYYEDDTTRVIYVQHKTNTKCFIAVYLLKENLYNQKERKMAYVAPWRDHCQYEALCEGDDYWTSPLKLHDQVSFLDDNPDYCLIHTDFDLSNGRPRNHYTEIYTNDCYFPGLLENGSPIATLTVMIRLDVYRDLDKDFMKISFPIGDYPMWIELSHEGKIKYLSSIYASYRVLESSASHSQSIEKLIKFKEAGVLISRHYAKKYGIELKKDGHDSRYYLDMMRFAYRLGCKDKALSFFKQSIKDKSVSLKEVIYFAGTIIRPLRKIIGNH